MASSSASTAATKEGNLVSCVRMDDGNGGGHDNDDYDVVVVDNDVVRSRIIWGRVSWWSMKLAKYGRG